MNRQIFPDRATWVRKTERIRPHPSLSNRFHLSGSRCQVPDSSVARGDEVRLRGDPLDSVSIGAGPDKQVGSLLEAGPRGRTVFCARRSLRSELFFLGISGRSGAHFFLRAVFQPERLTKRKHRADQDVHTVRAELDSGSRDGSPGLRAEKSESGFDLRRITPAAADAAG